MENPYIELRLDLIELKGLLQHTLEELEEAKNNYHALMAEHNQWKNYIENHNDICPMGGVG
jgi:hypothetical protein